MDMYRAAIFDMDGTILNTIEDLTSALNYAMKKAGHRHNYSVEEVKQFFGSGVKVAMMRAIAYEEGMSEEELVKVGTADSSVKESDEIDDIQKIFRPYYKEHCKIKTGPYEGILSLLMTLRKKGVKLAVVSNKQNDAVMELVKDQFEGYFDFVIGEKEGVRRKPAPDMIESCLAELHVNKEEAVYIGDSEIDIQSAKNAKMDCVSVSWGFRKRAFLEQYENIHIVDTVEELEASLL
jgi:phosphoglycolate phosphatase